MIPCYFLSISAIRKKTRYRRTDGPRTDGPRTDRPLLSIKKMNCNQWHKVGKACRVHWTPRFKSLLLLTMFIKLDVAHLSRLSGFPLFRWAFRMFYWEIYLRESSYFCLFLLNAAVGLEASLACEYLSPIRGQKSLVRFSSHPHLG